MPLLLKKCHDVDYIYFMAVNTALKYKFYYYIRWSKSAVIFNYYYIFQNCISIQSTNFPNTSWKIISDKWHNGCSRLIDMHGLSVVNTVQYEH